MKRTLVSSPNISDIDKLYSVYKSLYDNADATISDFYKFLSVDSIPRQLFLDEYCIYSYAERPYAFVLMITPKA